VDLLTDPGTRDLLEDADERDLEGDPGIQDMLRDLGIRERLSLGVLPTEQMSAEGRVGISSARSGGFLVPRRRSRTKRS